MSQVERMTGRRMTVSQLPSKSAVRVKQLAGLSDTLRQAVTAGGLDEVKKLLEPLLAELPAADVAAAAVGLLAKATLPADNDPEVIGATTPTAPTRQPRTMGMGRPRVDDHRPKANGTRGMTRVWIGAGRASGVGRREVAAVFAEELGVNARDLGPIDVADRFCLVDVPGQLAEYVVTALNGVRFNGRSVPVRLDREGSRA